MKKSIKIERPNITATPVATPVATPANHTPTGGITLASQPAKPSDPFVDSILQAGYTIHKENKYGYVASKEKGKPTFIPKTKAPFNPTDGKRNTVILPEEIDRAMKGAVLDDGITTTQYITQLIMKDLQERTRLHPL